MSQEQKIKKEYAENLSGLNGFVYLMFVGGERYAEEFRERFVKLGLVKNKENVNQAIDKLRKRYYLKFVGKERKARGPPAQLYTANLEPLKQTFSSIATPFLPWVGSDTKLRSISRLVFEYFPCFVSIEKKYLQYSLKNRSWDTIASTFLDFLVLIHLDFVLKKLDIPEIIKAQVAFMAPLVFLSTEGITDGRPLSTELNNLKEKIMQNLSPEEKAFFKNLPMELGKLGLLKSKGVKP